MEFVIGGVAAVCAGFFTNPLEVLKTRMQLQGELQAKGKHVIHYKNAIHAAYVVAKNDGVLALQKGLLSALGIQFIMNGMRFGTYNFAENRGYLTDQNGNLVFYKNFLITGTGGLIGHVLSNPLFIVKTHLQSQSVKEIAVGHQHHHKGTLSALVEIFKSDGIKGLYRGGMAAVPRAFVASTSQLTSFAYSRELLKKYDLFQDSPILISFFASLIGGAALSVAVTPFDLVLTRLYNQPVDGKGVGKIYKNYVDCVVKIYKTEGISAFYKGVGPQYMRLGPHTVLCLVFWDKFKDLYNRFIRNKEA